MPSGSPVTKLARGWLRERVEWRASANRFTASLPIQESLAAKGKRTHYALTNKPTNAYT